MALLARQVDWFWVSVCHCLFASSAWIAGEYIHSNPVRRNLAAAPTDWPWSSARDWAGLERPHLAVDRTLPLLHPDRR